MVTSISEMQRIRKFVITFLTRGRKSIWIQVADTGSLHPLAEGDVYVLAEFIKELSVGNGDICLIQSGQELGSILIVHRVIERRTDNDAVEFLHSPECPKSLTTVQWVPASSIIAKIVGLRQDGVNEKTISLSGRICGFYSAVAAFNIRMIIRCLRYRMQPGSVCNSFYKLNFCRTLALMLQFNQTAITVLFKTFSALWGPRNSKSENGK